MEVLEVEVEVLEALEVVLEGCVGSERFGG